MVEFLPDVPALQLKSRLWQGSRSGDILSVFREVYKPCVTGVARVVRWDRQLEDVLVEVSRIVLAARLHGTYGQGDDSRVQDSDEVSCLADIRNRSPVEAVVNDGRGVSYYGRREICTCFAMRII
jgi:hypothetical protein